MKRACSSASSPGRPRLTSSNCSFDEQRDAVEALLAMRLDLVAELLDLGGGEAARRPT